MSYYAIGIGGTGAKCLESLIYAAASGLMPTEQPLHLLYVDSDKANGNGSRTSELLKIYQELSSKPKTSALFKTQIPTLTTNQADLVNYWSPTKTDETLSNFINKSQLGNEYRYLLEILFSKEELEVNLNHGFRGRPAIGATVMARAIDFETTEPWKSLKDKINNDSGSAKTPKVLIFGSIFGGTGAAGFPTIAKILRNWVKTSQGNSLQIGGVLCLPYFTFNSNHLNSNELFVKPEDLIINSQEALRYYYQQEFHKILSTTYLLGDSKQMEMPVAATGSATQKNPSHWIEFYAALAAIDFYQNENSSRQPYQLISRKSLSDLYWTDFPDHNFVKRKIIHLAIFSFAFLHYYHPKIEELKKTKKFHQATWFINFFSLPGIDVNLSISNELSHMKEFCRKFLLWLATVQFSVYADDTFSKSLIDYSVFAEVKKNEIVLRDKFDEANFSKIFGTSKNLNKLFDLMNKSFPPKGKTDTAWAFISSLYENSQKI